MDVRHVAILNNHHLEDIIQVLRMYFQHNLVAWRCSRLLRRVPERDNRPGRVHRNPQLGFEDTLVPAGETEAKRRGVVPLAPELEEGEPRAVVEHACLADLPGLAADGEEFGSGIFDRVV